jgi:hypothetical protein
MQYLLLKCVERKMYDTPRKVLQIADLRMLVDQDPKLRWGREPRASIPIRNSNGSFSELSPHEGFLMPSVSEEAFAVCYEHNGGIAIHSPDEPRILGKCRELAEHLKAKVFQI